MVYRCGVVWYRGGAWYIQVRGMVYMWGMICRRKISIYVGEWCTLLQVQGMA